MARTYNNKKRANGAVKTREKIVAATEVLLTNGALAEVTLPSIAAGAGVTVQTVLRHMGSRNGVLAAVAERVYNRIDSQRGQTKPGDIDAAISGLLDHYEAESALVLNLLEQAGRGDEFAKNAARRGRIYHRNWVEGCFGPLIRNPNPGITDALIVATDIYIWKLLRLDMKRSIKATKAIINHLVRGILETS